MSFFERMDRRMASMAAMMDKVGVDVDRFATRRHGLDLAEAVRTCSFCGAGDVCSDWLRRAPEHVGRTPAFCPNAARFDRAEHKTEDRH